MHRATGRRRQLLQRTQQVFQIKQLDRTRGAGQGVQAVVEALRGGQLGRRRRRSRDADGECRQLAAHRVQLAGTFGAKQRVQFLIFCVGHTILVATAGHA